MKKLLSSLFVLLILFSIVLTTVNAEESIEIIFSKEEITDIDTLYERAKEGITDIESLPFDNETVLIKEEIDNEEIKTEELNTMEIDDDKDNEEVLETLSTTQKLKTIVYGDDETVDFYATTVFVDVTEEDLLEVSQEFTAAGEQEDDYNPNGTVRSYSTIYWQDRGSGSTREFRLTSASGGWTRIDSQVSISNRVARLGQTGETAKEYTPTANTFNYSAPSTWNWLNRNSELNLIGCTTEITITRGTSSWKQVFKNNLYGNPQYN